MILYFSATGNSQYVAEKIAEATGDRAFSIERFRRRIELTEGETLGFVTPTYSWEVPIIVRKYLEKLEVLGSEPSYTFVVATYGTTPGAAGADAAHLLKARGIEVSAMYSVQMPDTWTPIFDLSDPEKVKKQNEKAEAQIRELIEAIKMRKTGNMMKRDVHYPVRYISDLPYQAIRKTKHFKVEDNCIGCGLCEKKCPAKAIRLENGRPVWVKSKCVMCLRCLHHCPAFAIQYGRMTKKHGQYRHPGNLSDIR